MAEVDNHKSELVHSPHSLTEIENDEMKGDSNGEEIAAAEQDAADMRRLGKEQELKERSPTKVHLSSTNGLIGKLPLHFDSLTGHNYYEHLDGYDNVYFLAPY
jgi:hypothetical protein